MSNSRFLFTNLVEGATLKNGTGGGAPAREETSPYVMERAQYPDRYTVWSSSAAPAATTDVEFDMGSAVSVGAVALLGCRSVYAPQTLRASAYYTNTAYPAGPWTLAVNSSYSTGRDIGKEFSAPISARWWRVVIAATTTSQFTIGRIWLGTVTNLGVYHSPGATSSPFRNRIEQAMANGTFVVNDLGDPGRDIQLPFNQMESTLKGQVEGLSDQPGSFVYMDPDDNVYEVLLRGGRANIARPFTSLWSGSVDLARLP